jgi:hypothetical protein
VTVRQVVRKLMPVAPYAAIFTGDDWLWQHAGQPVGTTGLYALLAVTVIPFACRAILVPRQMRMAWRQMNGGRRPHIPVRLRRAVFAADGWACVACGNTAGLQLDHVRPWSCGGLNRIWNLVTLCANCNRVKSNYWVWANGRVTYTGWEGSSNRQLAAAILAVERRARRNPWRWCRAAFTLA